MLLALPAAVGALTAAPASAVSGYGVSGALRSGQTFEIAKTASRGRQGTCEKSRGKVAMAHRAASKSVDRRFAPVACEQPPKSEVDLSGAFKQASASALAAIG